MHYCVTEVGLLTEIRDRRVSSMHAGKCSAIVHVVVCG